MRARQRQREKGRWCENAVQHVMRVRARCRYRRHADDMPRRHSLFLTIGAASMPLRYDVYAVRDMSPVRHAIFSSATFRKKGMRQQTFKEARVDRSAGHSSRRNAARMRQ